MKLDSRDLALTGVITALYVTVNVTQTVTVGNPTIYGPIQLRVADCLLALAAILGAPVIFGGAIGCFLTNAYYFIGITDVILGPIANLIAATIIYLLRKHRLTALLIGSTPIGLIVGGYLWLFFPPPDVLNMMPVWAAMIVSITASSLVAVTVIGYVLLTLLSKQTILGPLKSKGLKTVEKK